MPKKKEELVICPRLHTYVSAAPHCQDVVLGVAAGAVADVRLLVDRGRLCHVLLLPALCSLRRRSLTGQMVEEEHETG
jgi:hypothetical protein